MFRLHRSKGAKDGERVDFKFSNFQANQVPKGWDKLYVSIISVETGKTLAKSSKALVRNGSCLWKETLTESVWIAQDHSSKEFGDCSFRFVVAMGSSRSGILGEATINATGYIDSITPVPLSFPLKKCSHGTTLQVNLHCLAPKSRFREERQDGVSSHSGDPDADFDAKSDGSQVSFDRSFGSSSGKDPESNSQPGETPRATSFSASDSHRSSISADGSLGRGTFSPRKFMNSDKYSSVTRLDSTGLPGITTMSVENSPRSNYSSVSSKDTGSESGQIALLKNVGSSKSLLEAAENTIEEIRAEAKMWERNARKLMIDLDVLKKDLSDQSSSKANLELELSAAHAESDSLKKEICQLEMLLEDMKNEQKAPKYSKHRSHIEKGLEDEIRFNRESNTELALQLKKAQESNIELVSILQELEETIETQKVEIQELSNLKFKLSSSELSIPEGVEESKTTITQLQSLEELEKLLSEKVQSLEKDVKEKISELEVERSLRIQLQQKEFEYTRKLSDKDDKILNLEAKLSVSLEKVSAGEPSPLGSSSTDLNFELEALKEKVQELERDCTELTDENLELLFKLKKYQNCSEKEGHPNEFSPREPSCKPYISLVSEEGETYRNSREAEMDKKHDNVAELELLEASLTCSEIFEQLHFAFSLVDNPLQDIQKRDYGNNGNGNVIDIDVSLKDEANCKEKADSILHYMKELNKALEALIVDWSSSVEVRGNETRIKDSRKSESHDADSSGSTIMSKSLSDLQSELLAANNSLDLQISANKVLEEKMTELEKRKLDHELHISELERENVLLAERISGLDAQLRYLTNEKESTYMELEKSQSLVLTLQDQLSNSGTEIEQKLHDQSKKMGEVQKENLARQEEIEYLKASNSKLQETTENVMDECDSLQKSNAKLRSQKLELHEQCTRLEGELREKKNKFTSCSKSVEHMENNLSLMLEDFSSTEKRLTLELNALFDKHKQQKEQLDFGESLLNQLYEDKTLEAERLQKEVNNLTQQITSLKSALTMAGLEKDRLESALRLMTDECETQKADKIIVREKIFALEKVASAYEDCKRIKNILEEKILRLEGGIIAKDAACAQDIELRNELGRIKSENRQLQRKIEKLEDENDQLIKNYQVIDEELKLLKEAKHTQNIKNDIVANTKQRSMGRRKASFKISQGQEHQQSDKTANGDQYHGQAENVNKFNEEVGSDYLSRIQFLENDLADALEANHLYKLQLKRLTEGTNHTMMRSKSSLEVELRDIKERYLHMSLKYAEVEAQREELVMKLKAARNVKKWF